MFIYKKKNPSNIILYYMHKIKTIKANAQLIDYYRYLNNDSQNEACVCTPVTEKSFSSQTNYANISNSQRIANILSSSVGGRTQFVNRNETFLSNNSNNSNSILLNNSIILNNSVIGFNNSLLGLGPRNKF